MNLRNETLTDQIATIIQSGHRDQKTSFEVAEEIVRMLEQEPATKPWVP